MENDKIAGRIYHKQMFHNQLQVKFAKTRENIYASFLILLPTLSFSEGDIGNLS